MRFENPKIVRRRPTHTCSARSVKILRATAASCDNVQPTGGSWSSEKSSGRRSDFRPRSRINASPASTNSGTWISSHESKVLPGQNPVELLRPAPLRDSKPPLWSLVAGDVRLVSCRSRSFGSHRPPDVLNPCCGPDPCRGGFVADFAFHRRNARKAGVFNLDMNPATYSLPSPAKNKTMFIISESVFAD